MPITLTLTLDEVNLILTTLAGEPYRTVADVIVKVRTQALEQVSPNAS